jgi:hypothetical protein
MLRCVNRQRAIIFCTAAFFAALIVPGSASAAGYDFPLSGYWPMNEGKGQLVRDWSGKGNNGQLGSTAGADANDPTWIRGLYGWSYGLHFDGNQFVTIPDSSALEPQRSQRPSITCSLASTVASTGHQLTAASAR